MNSYSPPPPEPGPVTADMVSVIMPTYNEAGNIIPLISRTLAAVGPGAEVIVVDDDSADGTGRLAARYAEEHDGVHVVVRRGEKGLTTAIARGVTESRRPVVVWMDCDLSMPPEDIPRLMAALEGRHIALGSRYVPGGRDEGHGALGRVLSRTICTMARLALAGGLTDYTSGFMCCRRRVVTDLGLRGDYGEYCIDLLHRAAAAGCSIREVAYVCAPRHAGESKTAVGIGGFLKRGPGYLATVCRLGLGRLIGRDS